MLIRDKTVKIRKPQQCFACLRNFESGKILNTQTISNDGRIYTIYSCEICDILLSEFEAHFLDGDEGFPSGCVREAQSEYKVDTPDGLLIALREEKPQLNIKL
jgi:hypothetical protein